jgi:hypothetical protein
MRDPSCGCGKCGKGGKGGKGCDTTCTTKDGPFCGRNCGCGKGGKGGCDSCQKSGKGGCGSKCGPLGGLLPGCCSCKPYIKKRLMKKKVTVCEKPILECSPVGKNGKGCGQKDDKAPAPAAGSEGDVESAPEVPEPPAVNVGRVQRRRCAPASYQGSGLFDILLR